MALTFKSVFKGLGKAAKIAAPIAGFALGPAAGIGLGLASGLGHGKKSVGKMLTGGALGGLGALGGKVANVKGLGIAGGLKNLGGKAVSGLAKAGKTVGKTAIDTFKTPQGGIDLSKLLGLGLGASSFTGARQEAKQGKDFNAANALLRQQMMERLSKGPDYSALMERITARPNYSFE